MTARAPRGFTLLEIMVAMVILTLIMTASFGALRLGEKSWETGITQTEKTETLRTVSSVLQRLLSQTLPVVWQRDAEKIIAFQGNSERIRFIGPAPAHHGSSGLFEYSLYLEPAGEAAKLRLRYRLHDPDQPDFSEEGSDHHSVTLLEDLESLVFSFYGTIEDEEKPRWQNHWSEENPRYPDMLRLVLIARAEKDQWPDLYLPLRLQPRPEDELL